MGVLLGVTDHRRGAKTLPIVVGAMLHGAGRMTLMGNAVVLGLTGIAVSRLFRRYRTASGSFG